MIGFFQLMVTVFKENLNFKLPLISYTSIRCIFETVFISEQIADNWFGTLLVIDDKFISSGFTSSCLKQFGKFENYTV